MSTNTGAVFAGVGQDLVTGTCLAAPLGTPLPAHTTDFFEEVLDVGFLDAGFIGEAGVTLSQGRSSTDIKDMDGTIIDTVQTEFNGTVQTEWLELNEVTLGNLVGAANVSVASATTTKGKRTAVAITGEDLDPKSWVFRMKAGQRRAGLIIPQGRLTDTGDIAFTLSGAASVAATVKCLPFYDSGSGKNVNAWLILDDGVYVLSLVPTIATALLGSKTAGDMIELTGTRFTGTTGVTVGGVSVGALGTGFIINNDSEMTIKLPAHAAGSAPIIVTNATGASTPKAYTMT